MDKYEFYDHSTMYRIKSISEEYVKQGKIDTEKVRKIIVHSIYDVVMK